MATTRFHLYHRMESTQTIPKTLTSYLPLLYTFILRMDQSSLPSSLTQLAIDAALDLRWSDALKLNKQIIKIDPQNIDALGRLGRAYMELGKKNLAKKYYSQVLKFDPYNPIALKNLKIIKSTRLYPSPHAHIPNGEPRVGAMLFLQEPGKTKVVNLLRVAEPQKLSQTYCGMKVGIAIKNRKVVILDFYGGYLGALPDDICHHLIRLIHGGNKYELFIKSVRVNSLSVLIKEIFRSKRFKNQPSFLENTANTTSGDLFTSINPSENNDQEEEEEEAEV